MVFLVDFCVPDGFWCPLQTVGPEKSCCPWRIEVSQEDTYVPGGAFCPQWNPVTFEDSTVPHGPMALEYSFLWWTVVSPMDHGVSD